MARVTLTHYRIRHERGNGLDPNLHERVSVVRGSRNEGEYVTWLHKNR